tara:strand:+ start:1413 stop:2525 length:1113 start_codon:yes stop_codon:yes gene_type:complete
MAKLTWNFYSASTGYFTAQVLSASYSTGRESQYDSYSPGGLTITIDNSANYVNNFSLADLISLQDTVPYTNFKQNFWLSSIELNDAPGNANGSTAVLYCTDVLGRLGRAQVFNRTITSNPSMFQISDTFQSEMPGAGYITFSSAGDSTAAGFVNYSSTPLDRLNLNMATEQGTLSLRDGDLFLNGRSTVAVPSLVIFDRTASGPNQIGYTNITRKKLGENYVNTFTVTPTVAAAQNAVNTAGQSTYGIYSGELASVDDTAAQALGLAQFMTYSRDDPDELSFTVEFNDLGNDLFNLMESIYQTDNYFKIKYKKPGSNTTTTANQILQGYQMEMTPEQTVFTYFFSPLTFVNFFTLDSATLGVLDSSRLGW